MTNHFECSIKYDKKNVQRMANIVCYARSYATPPMIRLSAILIMLSGFILILRQEEGLIMLAIGAIVLTNADVRGRSLGKKMCAFMDGWWPKMELRFEDDGIHSKTDRENSVVQYNKLVFLIEEGHFFYLITEQNSAFMIDKSTIMPKDIEVFQLYLMKKTRLNWTVKNANAFLSIISIPQWYKNRKLQKK